MEWLDPAVLLIRYLLALFLAYGAYLCVFRSRGPRPAAGAMRLAGATACVLMVGLVLAWQPRATQAEVNPSPAPATFSWPAPNPSPGGDGYFQAYEYH